MHRIQNLLAGLVVVVVAAASAQDVRLDKAPSFQPGDKITYKLTGSGERKVVGKDQKLLQQEKRTRRDAVIQEVLAVDESGRVQALRMTIVSAERSISSNVPKEGAFERKVAVRNVLAELKRKGLIFEVDPSTIASSEMKELTASQVALIKDMLGEVEFYGHREVDGLLLPTKPVAAGEKWQVPAAALAGWTRHSISARKTGATAERAAFQLEALQGPIASVRGTIYLKAPLGPVQASPLLELAANIDTASGLWITDSSYVAIAEKVEDVELIMEARNTGLASAQRGAGASSSAPSGLVKLGWPRPGPDANSYQNPPAGVSLNLPADYKQAKTDGQEGPLAQFVSPKGLSVAVTIAELPFPMDMPEVADGSLEGLKGAIKGYALSAQKKLEIPGGVPAHLLVGQAEEGRITVYTLLALDDLRLVSVSGSVPAGNAEQATEIQKILQSLRVFAPREAPATAPAPR